MEPLLYVCLAMVVLTVGRIKIVEVGFGRRLKVFNFAVIDNRNVDPGRHSEQLNHTLQVRGFEAKDAIIAAGGGNAEHSENQTCWCVRVGRGCGGFVGRLHGELFDEPRRKKSENGFDRGAGDSRRVR